RVATAFPYYPEWRIYPGYEGSLWREERLGDIKVLRAWHHATEAPRAFSRIAHELSLCLLSIPNIVRALRGASTAYIVSPDLALAWVASAIAGVMRKRRVLFVQDVMPDAAIELGMLRNPVLIAVSRHLARALYAAADEIYTLGNGMRRRIGEATSAPEKIRVVPNTIDAIELAPVAVEANRFRKQFVPEGIFAVVHAGNMGEKQNLPLLLRTAALLRDEPDIHFFVIGDGAVRDAFLRQKREMGLENVTHAGFLGRELLPDMLCGADVFLVSQVPEAIDIVVPSKLVTAMGAGAMVVAACAPHSETGEIVSASGGGITTSPEDESALARSILSVRDGEVDTARCRRNARDYAVKHFSRREVYGPIADSLRAAANGGHPSPRQPEAESALPGAALD
ncbi:MAG: glycosyltransferase, partial [Gemmatimonadaceae bacterium]|nr:glycosyltransferase [Gemmatimonadaceae bacterium]